MTKSPDPVVFSGPAGDLNLRDFVQMLRLARTPHKSVTTICQEAGISRANFYFLIGTETKPSEQVPTLETLVSLLSALGASVDLPTRPEHPIRVKTEQGLYTATFRPNSADTPRERTRVRATLASDAMESLMKGFEFSRSVPSTTRLGAALPLGVALGGALVRLQAKRLGLVGDENAVPKSSEMSQTDLPDLSDALADTPIEDIEEIIAALKAERDARLSSDREELSE